jgi:hypothetical protein
MRKTIKKKIAFFSIGTSAIILMVSFTSTVAFQTMNSANKFTVSPLFSRRLETIVSEEKTPVFSSVYIGQNKPVEIFLPTRDILTEDVLEMLTSTDLSEELCFLSDNLQDQWGRICSIARNQLPEINRIIREDYTGYQKLLQEFSSLSEQEAKTRLCEAIESIDFDDCQEKDTMMIPNPFSENITMRPICNITSGQFCQITSQPICQITTQPICSLTKGFFCWTIYGPICPTTGIKCHPPTSRELLCTIFTAAGKLLKSVILVLLLAAVVFIPLAILTIGIITVFNPERCDQMRQRITLWFNCTTPE